MPFAKIHQLLSQPIVLNQNYIRSNTGLLKCVQCLFGFISLISIWLSCRSNYDPYLGTNSGFVGGDVETCTILIHFTCFFISFMLITTYYFSIVASTIIPKTVFEFVYNLTAFFLLSLTSFSLLTIVIDRNHRTIDKEGFPYEPGFVGKIVSSSFGIANSMLYAVDTYYSYQSYLQS